MWTGTGPEPKRIKSIVKHFAFQLDSFPNVRYLDVGPPQMQIWTFSLVWEQSNRLVPDQREEKHTLEEYRCITQAAMEWKEALLVWRVDFHFSLIKCEVFKTRMWFLEINGKARLFPWRLTPLCVPIYNELSVVVSTVSCLRGFSDNVLHVESVFEACLVLGLID